MTASQPSRLEPTAAQAAVPCIILSSKIFARNRWKSLEFSNEPLNIRYGEPGRRRDCHGRKTSTD
jgi:hypothetical protein